MKIGGVGMWAWLPFGHSFKVRYSMYNYTNPINEETQNSAHKYINDPVDSAAQHGSNLRVSHDQGCVSVRQR